MLFVSQHERISRVSFLVCLSAFACTLVHSNSPTTSTDSLACIAGALTKQLSDLPLSKTCVAHVSDIVIEYTRVPQQDHAEELRGERCPLLSTLWRLSLLRARGESVGRPTTRRFATYGWRSRIIGRQSAQLAQWAELLVRTALRSPRPPNDIGNVAESLVSESTSGRSTWSVRAKHCNNSWSCRRANSATVCGSTHRSEYVARAPAQCARHQRDPTEPSLMLF